MKGLLLGIWILLNVGIGAAQTSSFTFQGKLADGGAAANGTYDITFKLYDTLANGTQVGTDIVRDDVVVSDGAFSVDLDFGAAVFANGASLFLQIEVRPGASTGTFDALVPRQPLTSSPYAVKAASATSADSLSATCGLCITDANIANASITAPKIADGAIVSGKIADSAISTSKLIDGSVTGTKLAPGTVFRWNVVTSNQQAEGNTGYILNSNAELQITLPFSPAVGDVIRVTSVGNGGFRINQNFGQSITYSTGDFAGVPWTPGGCCAAYKSIASSRDGNKIVVATRGQIYTSTDSGVTFTARNEARHWESVASSADGTKLIAVNSGFVDLSPSFYDKIHISNDSGVTWTLREDERYWKAVASSGDGTNLAAAVAGGQIYTSADSGVTWTARESNRNWQALAISDDGTRLAAVVNGGQIYTSTDSGATWVPRETSRAWESITSSIDGTKLVAVASAGQIYTSADSGVTWTPRESIRNWATVASSVDGGSLVAAVNGGQIYTSTDSGATWTPQESPRQWRGVASNANGSKLFAIVFDGQTYVRGQTNTAPGEFGRMTGSNSASVELIFIGFRTFLIVSHKGTIALY